MGPRRKHCSTPSPSLLSTSPRELVIVLSTCFDSSEMTTGVYIFKPSGLKRVSHILKFRNIQEPGGVFLSKLFAEALTDLLAQWGVEPVPLSKLAQERATL